MELTKERQQYRDFPGSHWLRLHAPNVRGPGLIPGQGTRSHMLQLRVHMPQQRWKSLHA